MLEIRIADALSRPVPSTELSSLLTEVSAAAADATHRREAANARALDPCTPSEATEEARNEMREADFATARMNAAEARLRDMLTEAVEREQAALVEEARSAALTERDALATELAAFYPPMAKKLAELLRRIDANDRKLGLGEGAEDLARGPPANWRTNPTSAMPSLVHGVRLPAFELSQFGTGYVYGGMRGR